MRDSNLTPGIALRVYAMTLGGSLVLSVFPMPGRLPWYVVGPAFGVSISTAVILMILVLPKLRRASFLATIGLQVLAISFLMVCAFTAALAVCVAYSGFWLWDPKLWQIVFIDIYLKGGVIPYALLTVCITFVITAIQQVSRKLGPGVLLNWLTGKYHSPVEEERIFMFLDMKDSTSLAEQLGNLKFSALVRDFFAMMGGPCAKHHAMVSHYIGDEAVISWQVSKGVSNSNCIQFFFAFEREIATHAKHFKDSFGVVPGFKAGLHVGPVVATEVGDAKSEIVFHGDVMNTTARIQGLCAELGESLLISGDLRRILGDSNPEAGFTFTPKGTHQLKGRAQPVELYGVSKKQDG